MSTIWTFDNVENKHGAYRGENCMKKFCESFKEHATKIINFEKKKMIPLTKEQQESYEETKTCRICKKCLNTNTVMIKIVVKLKTIVTYTGKYKVATHNKNHLKYSIPK